MEGAAEGRNQLWQPFMEGSCGSSLWKVAVAAVCAW